MKLQNKLIPILVVFFLLIACDGGNRPYLSSSVSPISQPTLPARTSSTTIGTAIELLTFRGRNTYNDSSPHFRITYAESKWMLDMGVNDQPHLILKTNPECRLRLREGPRQYLYVKELLLADQTWEVYTPGPSRPNILIYHPKIEEGYFLFSIFLPSEDQTASRTECELEAEIVLGTFILEE